MSDIGKVVPCPYKSLPATAYWRRGVGGVAAADLDPVTAPRFQLDKSSRIATAGSCFAQHIARYIRNSGGTYLVTEPGHPLLDAARLAAFNYGTFSSRFGNIYTTRQLLQLLQRAYGLRQAVDDVWREKDGSLVDPFRPFIQPGGFQSLVEYEADRRQHYAAVRRMVEEADVFVFTLGLTEAWENSTDGMVYGACPGCGAGQHVVGQSRFHNFSLAEVHEDLVASIAFMRERNPGLKVLLTVSPVPLIATFTGQHVLAATTYSKSVLRVAAQMVVESDEGVDYFPSYEIITGGFNRGAYFGPDLRDVEEVGVRHAMRTFFRNYCVGMTLPDSDVASAKAVPAATASQRVNTVVCDEERLDEASR